MKITTRTLAGTALLAALVVVFDYALKYSNLKIIFPWLPYLKFDFTGIPIVLATLLFGLIPGVITSAVASIAILARSGDVLGSSMKGLAEFSTILGLAIGLKLFNRFKVAGSSILGIVSRVFIMTIVNITLVYAVVLSIPSSLVNAPFLWILLVGIFNTIQGAISIIGGFFIYAAIRKRVPSIIKKTK